MIYFVLGEKSDVSVQTTLRETSSENTCDKKGVIDNTSATNLDRQTTNKQTAPQQVESVQPDISHVEKICPVCSLAFSNDIAFMDFQRHVVDHFVAEDHPEYEVL